MKQFLRHIFLLLTLFMATTNAWAADCTYTKNLNGSSHTSKDFNHTICSTTSEAPNVAVSIKYTIYLKKTTLGKDLEYTLYAIDNSNQQHEIASGLKVENGKTVTVEKSFNLNKDITSFKIDQTSGKFGGNRDITISNVTVTYKYAPSLTTSDPTPLIEDTPVGSSSFVSFLVDYQNSTNSVTFAATESSDTNNSFSISPTSKSITDCSGSIEYTITFSPQSEQKDAKATYVISGNGASLTVTVTATSFATVKPEYTCDIANSYMVDDSAIDLNYLWTSTSPAQKNYNIVSWTPSGSNNTNAVQPAIKNNFLSLGQAGILVLSLSQAETDGYYADSDTKTITINKYGVDAFISQSSALRNEIIDNPFSLSYGLIDFDVESKNTNIAEYHKDTKKIQTYFTDGKASFQITRPEDYKYNKLDKSLTLDVYPDGGCLVLEPCSGSCNVPTGEDFIPVDLTGPADYLSFQARKEAGSAVGNIEIKQYVNNEWKFIDDANPGTDWRDYGYTLDESATKVGFFTSAGSYRRYFQNVQVTRKTYLRPSSTEFTLPQTNIGKSSEKTFDLSWSTCSDDIKLVPNNDLFEVGTTQINTTAHTGTTNNILVRFKGANEPGTYSAVITIYDQSQSKEVHVSCVVKDRLATTIVYTGETQYSETQDCIEGKFSVVDENGNTVTGANIVLTSSNNDILEICDNAGFMPHCGGSVTLTANYAGDEIYAPAEWSREITVANCYQTIDWEQDFRQFIAAEDGTISQRIELTAKAVPTDFAITYELDEAAQKFASLEKNQNGQWFLVIFGIGTGYIIASAPSGTDETKYYDAASLMHEIRVRKWGDKCNTDESVASDEITLSALFSWFYDDEEVIGLDGRPYERMEFYSHVSSGSGENELTVSFSADEGATWSNSQTYTIPETYDWNTPYIHANVPDGANQVKFKTTSTGMTYFNMVKMVQKTYLEPNVTEIRIDDAIVNQQFSREFKVKYSDIPLLQYVISDLHDLGLKLTSTPAIANDCGDWGEYTFTLTGESPYPQKNVTETITFYTSAGDVVNIPVTITANLSDTYYFNQQAGNWGDLNNWRVNKETTPTKLPTASNPVVITRPMTINEGELVAYGVTIAEGGSVNIQPKGGLTLHAGGFTDGVTKDNFTILNNQDGVGYVRVSPYFTREVEGTMPNITVQYTTRAMAGGAKDQVWQYVGAPGNNMQMSNDGVMVYLWSEKDGWVYSDTHMTPFAGYALTRTAEGSGIYNISAQPINGNHTIDLTYTQGAMEGGNLFVNSYLAPIDVTKFTDDTNDFEGDIEKTFYLFNSGSWEQWQGQGGSTNTMVNGSSAGQYYAIAPFSAAFTASEEQKVIPPMQGVYVVVGENGGKIKLQYNKHIFRANTKDMNRPMRAPQEEMDNFMRLRLQVNSQNSGADRMYVIQHENTTRGYDNGYDAKNILAEGQANIYTNEVDGQMEISVADQIDSTFIGFTAGEDSVYTLTFTSLVGQDMYLHDLVEDSLFLLVEDGQYTFSAQANSVNDMRFQLILHPELPGQDEPEDNMTTGMDNVMSSARVWVNDKRIYIAAAPQNSTIAVYTVSGMCITSPLTIHETPCTVDLSHLPTGVYVLRLNNQAYKFVCK